MAEAGFSKGFGVQGFSDSPIAKIEDATPNVGLEETF